MSEEKSPLDIVEALAAAINRHDVDAIMQIVHDQHVFVDSLGNEVRGASAVRKAWEAYLAKVPDYWVRIDHGVLAPEYIALFGAAGGTLAVDGQLKSDNWWETTAAWRAEIAEGRVVKWQVYANNQPIGRLTKKGRPLRKKKTPKRESSRRKRAKRR